MSSGDKCRDCGAIIPPESPGGYCAHCLLALGLEKADAPPPENTATAMAPAAIEKAGDRIGHYRLLQQIGHGGCGVVYMAEQEEPVRRRVALKVIKLGMDTRQVVARFGAERQALAMMDHPNIAKVLDAGATETGRPYFVMELVRGIRITDYCDQNKLPTAERLKLFTQVCQAIQHAHQKGIIHRDIKPSNILVSLHDGVPLPKVIDFGIAKATQGRLTDQTLFTAFEQFIGTPAYMSPEQAEVSGLDIDTRSDIYSLGVLLYELLVGRTPFDKQELVAAGLDQMRRTIREKEPLRPSTRLRTMVDQELDTTAEVRRLDKHKLIHLVSGDLDWIVMKCLQKDRARRYETANGLAGDVERHLENQPVAARPPSRLYRLQRLIRRNRLAFGASGAVLVALVIGLCVSTQLFLRERRTRQRAVAAEKQQSELRRQAEVSGKRLAESLTRLDLERAEDLLKVGKTADALAHLSGLLRANPADRVLAERLLTLLTQRTFVLPLFESIIDEAPIGVANLGPEGTAIGSAQFSPDGSYLLIISGEGARVFDARNGRPITAFVRHIHAILTAQFSPDGKRVVTGSSDGDAKIWEVLPGEPPARLLQSGRGDVRSATFSPDGQRLVTGSMDQTARIWDANTGSLLTDKLGHKGTVAFADFSPNGREVITCSYDGTARIWNAQTAEPVTELLPDDRDWVRFAQFSPDGQRVLTASGEMPTPNKPGSVRVWDARTGRLVAGPLRHNAPVRYARFSPDGKFVASASDDNTARIWDAETGKPLTQPLNHEGFVRFLQFHPSGQFLLTVSWDGIARIWDVHTGNLACEPLRHEKGISSAQFSPDGQRIVTAAGKAIQMWEPRLVSLLPHKLCHGQTVQAACFSPNGSRVVTASGDSTEPGNGGSVKIWDPWNAKSVAQPILHQAQVRSIRLSPDGRRLLTLSGAANPAEPARLWDAQSGRLLSDQLRHKRQITSAQFSPDGVLVVTTSDDGTARIWDAQQGAPLGPPLEHELAVRYAEFSPDGRCIAIASGQLERDHKPIGTVEFRDARTGMPVSASLIHGALVSSVHFSPDGRKLVTISDDKAVRVWDPRSGRLLAGPLTHKAAVRSAQFSPNSRNLVTASDDGSAQVWDAATGKAESPPLRHQAEVYSATFFPDGLRVLTASRDKTVRVWDASTGQPLSDPFVHDKSVQSAEVSSDGHWILTASGNYAFLWEVISGPVPVPDWLPELGEAIGAERLNSQGIMEPVRFEELLKIKQTMSQLPTSSDFYSQWANWFWADRSTRPVSPSSHETVAEYVQRRLEENTIESSQEALKLAPGNPLAIARISDALTNQTPGQIRGAQATLSLTPLEKIPSRDPRAGPELLDLSPFYNASLTENWYVTPEDNDLSELPSGLQIFAGVQFDVRGLIQVGYVNKFFEKYPEKVTGIPVARPCRKLHFLHSAVRGGHFPMGVQIGGYIIRYTNGRQVEFPIVIGQSVACWQPDRPDTWESREGPLTLAWSGFSANSRRLGLQIRIYKSTWENPTPSEPVQSIDFVSKTFAPAPFLVAITLE
jgi:WD40 repeat protein/serine/threonine protein kinase